MRPRIVIACNSRGRMLDICLAYPPIREAVWSIFSDRDCGAYDLVEKHHLVGLRAIDDDDEGLSDRLLSLCGHYGKGEEVYVVSTGYTRLFRGAILQAYRGHILNTHFSILPAFPGRKSSDWTGSQFPPRAIFERTLAFGARITGNTVHLIDDTIDGGRPVIQSSMVLPYDEPPEASRHRLFIQECQCLMQTIMWLSAGRLSTETDAPVIAGARFDSPIFSPAIEDPWIRDFNPDRQV